MRDSGNVKNSGEAIEKVLAGLRDAEAPAGMERRILERLEGRVSVVETRSGWRRLVPMGVMLPTKTLICGAALAGLVAMVLAIPAIRRLSHAPLQSKSGAVTGAPREGAPAVAATEPERSSGGSQAKSGTMAKVPDGGLVRVDESREPDSNDESVAMSEMQAASFPAPPMPLTAQERLLLRLTHKVDPVEMAVLDPKFRAMQDAEEKAEFQRFFGQTATKQAAPVQANGELSMEQVVPQSLPADQGVAAQPVPDQAVPAQLQMDPATPTTQEPTQNRPVQQQAAPEQSYPNRTSPEQSRTQQPTATPTETEEKE